jgi:hypothetical protein
MPPIQAIIRTNGSARYPRHFTKPKPVKIQNTKYKAEGSDNIFPPIISKI